VQGWWVVSGDGAVMRLYNICPSKLFKLALDSMILEKYA